MSRKKYYDLEKVLKGASNHRRIEVLFLLYSSHDIATEEIIGKLRINYQTGTMHLQKLVRAGLVDAHRQGSTLIHNISKLGKSIIYLLKNI